MQVIKQLNLPIKEKTILQADAFYEPLVSTLNLTIQNKLIKVIEFLKKFSQPYQSNDLANFKNKYIETYEEKELPLLEVLDKESGIGYPNKDQLGVNPLVEEFLFAQQGNGGMQYDTSFSDQFLLKKLIEAYKNDVAEISFKDEDLSDFPHPQFVNTTITMSIMFRLIDAKKDKIYVSLIGGNSSAANLLGRFAHGEGKILNIIQEIAQFEKNAVEDRIIAEIVHLPQSRIGNIVLRPIFRDYEIPYLGKSALPTEYQISMEDIMVSVKNNRIVLRSKKLNKEVLPRLSSAHNYSSYLSLPVYKFLGDMQIQDVNLPALLFNWGRSSFAFKFLPRAEYEGVVLIPATWNLIRADYEVLLKEVASDNLMNEVKSWVKKWKMPRHILLKDADNELFIDLESELSVKTFLDTIKKRGNIELVEFLFDAESALVLDEKGSPFTNEIIAVLFNNDYIRKDTDNNTAKSFTGNKVVNKINNIKIKRTFPIGSEWLFYKIYCGVKSADKILIQVIKPLVDALTSRGLIEKWFFIRYNDPDFHIRVRFFNSDINNIGEIIKIAYHHLNPLQEKGIISKIMIDTYIRELERYSSSAIGISEEYYSLESNMALQLLSNLSGENSENIKLFYALRSIDDLLDIMQFTPGLKLGFMEFQKNNFINEHGGHKDLKLRLDDKFRRLRKDIENILTKKKDNEIDSISVVNILNWRKQKLLLIIPSILKLHEERQLETSLNTLLSSYLHMNINRIFLGKQRTYEMVIYDILYRYYKSMIARESKDKKAKTKIN